MKYFYNTAIIIGIVLLGFIALRPTPTASLGASTIQGTFHATGTTNTKVVVNSTSTQVVPAGFVNIAIISTGAVAIACSLDNLTAASSSATTSVGIIIPTNSIRTFGPFGDIPYLGAINCVGSTTVGVTFN